MEQLVKQPNEIKTISVDFTNSLATGEVISATGVSSINIETGVFTTSTIIDPGSVELSGNIIIFRVRSGLDGEFHKIIVSTGITNLGNRHEEDIIILITEDINTFATVDELKRQLEITDTSKDIMLFQLTKAATEFVENFTGRKYTYKTYTETFQPESTTDSLLLQNFPANSITSVVIEGITLDAQTVDVDNYVLDKSTGVITRVDGDYFPRMPIKTVITYKAGFPAIPEDLRDIVKKIVISEYNMRRREGVKSETIGAYTVRFANEILEENSDIYKALRRRKRRLF